MSGTETNSCVNITDDELRIGQYFPERRCVTNNEGFTLLCLQQLVLRNVLVALTHIRMDKWQLDIRLDMQQLDIRLVLRARLTTSI